MNKKILLISVFIFMIVLSIGAVSAQDADDAIASNDDDTVLEDSQATVSGTVSGGVDIVTENPNEYTGELNYDIPEDARTIKSADVYVNIYGVRTDDKYGANVNTTIKTANGEKQYNESLCYVNDEEDHSIVHYVNDHVTKVYLNYMIHYDIKDLVSGLNGTKLTINVDSFEMANKSFDGKIKLIGLVLAYNDDSDDETISYWINDNQLWTKTDVNLTFNTEGKSGITTLTNVILSSSDGSFKLNDEFLGDARKHITGKSTFQYNEWDVTDLMNKTRNTTLNVANVGASLRNSLSILTINDVQSSISAATEYANTAFAGTNNTLTVTVSASKSGKYVVKLLADGVIVDETEVTLADAAVPVLLTDPTIRAVDESTVNGADYKKVTYTVELLSKNQTINSTSINPVIMYNGYLGKDLAYPAEEMESLPTIVINGDIIIDNKPASSKLGSSDMNRTDVWTVDLNENASIAKSFIYLPYNWFNNKDYTESLDMFTTTFNNVTISPVSWYRDQSNLGGASGKYGYGVFIYDVTDLLNKSGENRFVLNKVNKTPSFYPSVLVYMYNTTDSDILKEIYINHGADLLTDHSSSLKNSANRVAKADSTFDVYSKLTLNATLYVFASNAQNMYGDIIFNGEYYSNVWNGSLSYSSDYRQFDVTGKIRETNSISFVGTGGSILALQQIMVLTKNAGDVEISLAPEYPGVAYAGTTNAITVTVDSVKAGKFNATLLADGIEVNKKEIELAAGKDSFIIIDPTVRAVDEFTVKGAANNKVNYTLQLSSGKNATISLPILYNGNLGKDLAYPAGGMESFINITINGDIVIDVKDLASYLKGDDKLRNKTDIWAVNLDNNSNIVKSFVYVPYNWCDPALATEDLTLFNATFNGEKITPVKLYRDQSNLGGYGAYGYGVLVYDVTSLMNKSGDNTLFVSRAAKYPAIYPSVLVYMYNTTGSTAIKNVYISNGVDLLAESSSTFKNKANRTVKSDSTINVDTIADSAMLYVFAASAQKGESNIIFNGQENVDVWSGGSSTTDLYTLDITKTIKNKNDISFVSTGSTILALQQIIVVTKNATAPAPTPVATTIAAPKEVKTTYNTNGKLTIELKDSNNNPVADAKVVIVLNGVKNEVKTDAKGQASMEISAKLVPKTYDVSITFAGDDTHIKSSANTKVIVKKAKVKLTAKKKTFKAKVKTKKYTVTLKDNKGKAMKKVKLSLKVKGKTVKATTNKKGKATFKIKNLKKKGTYKAKITFKGDKYFNKLTKKATIKIKK